MLGLRFDYFLTCAVIYIQFGEYDLMYSEVQCISCQIVAVAQYRVICLVLRNISCSLSTHPEESGDLILSQLIVSRTSQII